MSSKTRPNQQDLQITIAHLKTVIETLRSRGGHIAALNMTALVEAEAIEQTVQYLEKMALVLK